MRKMKGQAYEWLIGLIFLGTCGLVYILFREIFSSHLYTYFTTTVSDPDSLIMGGYLNQFWVFGVPVLFVFIVMIYILTRSQRQYAGY